LPNYLISRDATIPVIEKQSNETKYTFAKMLIQEYHWNMEVGVMDVLHATLATPKQLTIALLKASGKWKE
jgi:hypothetical protein